MSVISILIVEDELIVAAEIEKMLTRLDYSVIAICATGEKALACIEEQQPNIVLMDIQLQGQMDGIDASKIIRQKYNIPVVFITAYSDDETILRAKLAEPYGYIIKPFKLNELHAVVEVAVYKHVAEGKLKESEDKYRRLFQQSNDAIFLHTLEGIIVDVNDRAVQLLEYNREELLSQLIADMHHIDDRLSVLDTFSTMINKKDVHYESRMLKKNGDVLNVEISACLFKGEKKYIQCIIRDITEQKRIATRLKESEKLAAQGQLAAKIAHEINNPLGGIKNSFLLIKECVPQKHPHFEYVARIEKEIDRIARIVRQMMEMYRPGEKSYVEYDICEIIQDVISFVILGDKKRNVTYCCSCPDNDCKVPLVKDYLVQILFNLIQNAVDATSEDGEITIDMIKKNQTIIISVKDDGTGIADEIQRHIFEPFFTTKNDTSQKGLGLGLSVSRSMVESMGGSLDFETNPKKGTTFIITLPVGQKIKGEK